MPRKLKPSVRSVFDRAKDGSPAGGRTFGSGFSINWHSGIEPTEETPKNGATVEDILNAAIDRLEFIETEGNGKYSTGYRTEALTLMNQALTCLHMKRPASK